MNPEEFRRTVLARRAGMGGDGKKASVAAQALNAAGAVLGAALGIYAGVIFLVPCLASVAVIVLGHRLFNEDRRCILLAFGIQGGQLIWLVIGALIQHRVGAFFIDLAWLLGSLIWLAVRPGLLPTCLLGIYQLLSLLSKVLLFVHAQVGTSMHKALLVHLVWHVAALAALGMLFVALRGRHAAHGMTRSD